MKELGVRDTKILRLNSLVRRVPAKFINALNTRSKNGRAIKTLVAMLLRWLLIRSGTRINP